MHWIDELDLKIKRNWEEQGLLSYKGLKSREFNQEKLNEKAREMRSLILAPEVSEKIKTGIGKEEEPKIKRKAEILNQFIIQISVDYTPELFQLRNEIEEMVNKFRPVIGGKEIEYSERAEIQRKSPDRKKRKEAYYGFLPLLKQIEGKARDTIKIANELAKNEDFDNYFELKASFDDLTVEEITNLFNAVCEETEDTYKRFIKDAREKLDISDLKSYDLSYAISKFTSPADSYFPKDKLVDSLRKTLKSFSIDLDALPVKIEMFDIVYGGICFVLGPKDIRLVLNPKDGFEYYTTIFHEFGHAIHFYYQPKNSMLLTDNAILKEGLAEVFAGFNEEIEWLSEFTKLDDEMISTFIQKRKIQDAHWIRQYIMSTMFEIEIYKNPEVDFSSLWNEMSKKYLGVEAHNPVWSYFVFYFPGYVKNCVFARMIKKKILSFCKKEFENIIGNPEVVRFLIEKFYKPGNLIPWKEKIEKAIGEKLQWKNSIE